jgi:molybdate transport system substrate-binding protein
MALNTHLTCCLVTSLVSFMATLTPLTTSAADLTVSAAASLTNVFKALGPLFEAQNPGAKLVFNFAASDSLVAQIAAGAPVDVLASADVEAMERADAQKLLVAGSRRSFASNTLVLVVPSTPTSVDAFKVTSLNDLQTAQVKRVAMGNPASVPVGRYTQRALQAAAVWPALSAKVVLAQNVRQALDYVARGEVEAGFVYATDAAVMKDRVKVVATVPTETPITYPVAAISGSRNPAAAQRFIAFLLSPAAQAVLVRDGFSRAEAR